MTAKFGEWKTATFGEPRDVPVSKKSWDRAIKNIHTKQPKKTSSGKKRLPSRRKVKEHIPFVIWITKPKY
jgi:hypothetical protein